MRFPVRGDKDYVEKQIKELKERGFIPLDKPKLIPSASLNVKPKWFVMMENKNS